MTKQRQERAKQARAGISVSAIVGLLLLLVIPACALSQFAVSLDWRLLAGVPLVLSVFAFLAYRSDKRRAEAGEWRIPESTLHMAELFGGWPGAFLGQRAFRHKISKNSYQIEFWLIVLVHQLAAVDCLAGWTFTKQAWKFIQAHIA